MALCRYTTNTDQLLLEEREKVLKASTRAHSQILKNYCPRRLQMRLGSYLSRLRLCSQLIVGFLRAHQM